MTSLLRNISWKKVFSKTSEDNVFRMAASLAYYSALSLAPLLILILNFISWINESYKAQLFLQIKNLGGVDAGKFIESIATHLDQQPNVTKHFANIFGLLTLLISASAIFGDLKISLNSIFTKNEETVKKPDENQPWLKSMLNFLKDKLFNIGLVLGFIFISMVSLVISSVLSLLAHSAFVFMGQFFNFVVSVLIYGILFSTIYYFLPSRRIKKRIAFISGLLTAFLFSIGKTLIGLYIGQSAMTSLYGAAGSFIVLLVWVFYSAVIFFFSAEMALEITEESEQLQ
ncbi:MAG: YihY/virulence factor BrkB family protein [Bdellovibrio sp.]